MNTNSPAEAEKEVIKKTIFVALIPLTFTIIMGEKEALLGLIFGLSISILLFRLKRINIEKSLTMSSDKANTYIRNRYFLNLLIYFVVLAVAINNSSIDFLAVVVGILLMKFTIIAMAFIDNIKKSFEEKKDERKGG
ncbi:MAG: ATP synthase subunit I [Bacillota bacterium]